MEEWIEEDIDLLTDKDKGNRVLDQHMIRAPIRHLNPRPPVSLPPSATVDEMIRVMREHRIGCVLVVEAERLVGIITERDLLLKLDRADVARPISRLSRAWSGHSRCGPASDLAKTAAASRSRRSAFRAASRRDPPAC